jgi:hypothetical protein
MTDEVRQKMVKLESNLKTIDTRSKVDSEGCFLIDFDGTGKTNLTNSVKYGIGVKELFCDCDWKVGERFE